MSKAASISHEINLLGLTVDEAVAKLDKYLDDAYISRIPQVRIVHGKGTGALRNGVTATCAVFLISSRSVSAKSARATPV